MPIKLAVRPVGPEGEPDEAGSSHHVLHRHKSPETAIVRKVSIVAHYEQALLGHGNGAVALANRVVLVEHDEVISLIEMLDKDVEVVRAVLGVVERLKNLLDLRGSRWIPFDLLIVDGQGFVAQLDAVARNSNHALDVVNAFVFGVLKDDDVPSLGESPLDQRHRMTGRQIRKGDIERIS